jgi:uncharacterized membrane protein YczE
MKKISKSSELLWLFGIIFVALGVAVCNKADLGVSMIAAPTFVVYEAIASIWNGFSIGVVEYALQGIILIILCVFIQRFKWRYLLAFAVAVIYGYTLDLFIWILNPITFDAVWLRWVMLIVGDLITGFGVACFFRTYMPLQVHELFVAETVKRYRFPLPRVKSIFDITLLVVSITLALVLFGDVAEFDWSTIYYSSFHSIGLGTLLTTLINSPIISFMGKLIDKSFDPTPRFPKLERAWNK